MVRRQRRGNILLKQQYCCLTLLQGLPPRSSAECISRSLITLPGLAGCHLRLALSPGWVAQLWVAALIASVLADGVWYFAGRWYGYRVLSGLCRLSLNPGSCVSQAESFFMRWGVWSLVFAKFVPGFAIVGPPIAGALGLPLFRFLSAAAVGAFLWAGGAMLLGYAIRVEVRWLMGAIDQHAGTVVAVVTGTVGAWLSCKLLRRLRFQRTKDVQFIAADDLMTAMGSAQPPLLIDLRGPARSLLE